MVNLTNARRRPGILLVAALALAASAIACGGGDSSSDSASDTTSAGAGASDADAVAIRDFAFGPAENTVEAGTTVTWENFDSFAHTVVADGGAFRSSDRLGEGDAFEVTFDQPGRYPYMCGIHNSMKGTIVVA